MAITLLECTCCSQFREAATTAGGATVVDRPRQSQPCTNSGVAYGVNVRRPPVLCYVLSAAFDVHLTLLHVYQGY